MSCSTQVYRSLAPNEIRLLFLHPGSAADCVRCHLEHVKLSENPQYEALSYMWGADDASYPIEINNERYLVRENLFDALQQLRRTDASRALWIDALCINQADNNERNHQVSQMGMLYSQAETVCIWLGRRGRDVPKSFDFISSHSTVAATELDMLTPRDGLVLIAQFFGLNYWRRLWIVQEVALATKIDIYWNYSVMPWSSLAGFLHVATNNARSEPSGMAFIEPSIALRLQKQRELRAGGGVTTTLPIFTLAKHYEKAKCADVRDRIFALLSLASSCCREAIPIDYTIHPYRLCSQVLRHHSDYHIDHWDPDTIACDLYNLRKSFGEGEETFETNHNKNRESESEAHNFDDNMAIPKTDQSVIVRGYSKGHVRSIILSLESLAPEDLDDMCDEMLSYENYSGLKTSPSHEVEEFIEAYAQYVLCFMEPVTEARLRSMSQEPYQDTSLHKTERLLELLLDDRGDHIRYSISLLIREIIRVIRNSANKSHKNYVSFLDDMGLIGLGPAGTQVDDIFVRFDDLLDTRFSAVIRRVDEMQHRLVGRAIYLTSCPRGLSGCQEIDFQTDIQGLQILTRPTRYDLSFNQLMDLYWNDPDRHRKDFNTIQSIINTKAQAGAGI